MVQRPGVMLYFDVVPCLERLSMEEKGRLFEAILYYGQFGVVPELKGMVGMAWDFIRPRLDKDAERYEEKRERLKANAKKRWEKEEMQTDAIACKSMPTTTTNSTSSSSSSSASTKARGRGRREADFNSLRNDALSLLDGLGF